MEDNELIRELMVAALQTDHDVAAVASLRSAVCLVRDRRECIDLVITDANLGDGSAGDLIEVVDQERPETPTIVVSGQPQAQAIRAAAFVAKPFSRAELLAAVENSL